MGGVGREGGKPSRKATHLTLQTFKNKKKLLNIIPVKFLLLICGMFKRTEDHVKQVSRRNKNKNVHSAISLVFTTLRSSLPFRANRAQNEQLAQISKSPNERLQQITRSDLGLSFGWSRLCSAGVNFSNAN